MWHKRVLATKFFSNGGPLWRFCPVNQLFRGLWLPNIIVDSVYHQIHVPRFNMHHDFDNDTYTDHDAYTDHDPDHDTHHDAYTDQVSLTTTHTT